MPVLKRPTDSRVIILPHERRILAVALMARFITEDFNRRPTDDQMYSAVHTADRFVGELEHFLFFEDSPVSPEAIVALRAVLKQFSVYSELNDALLARLRQL